jgi:hypothetical protein
VKGGTSSYRETGGGGDCRVLILCWHHGIYSGKTRELKKSVRLTLKLKPNIASKLYNWWLKHVNWQRCIRLSL